MDLLQHNRLAWNKLSDGGIAWGIPVSAEDLNAARQGQWQIQLAGNTPVPRSWFGDSGDVQGQRVLCLAAGGGQQAPLLAAAGAHLNGFIRRHAGQGSKAI